MKKNLLFLLSFIIATLFSGCAKMYVEPKSSNVATLQLIPKSKTLILSDNMYAGLSDYSKGCAKMVELGVFGTDSDTPSKVVKIPAEIPLLVKVSYFVNGGNSSDNIDFVLTPKKNKDYIIEYVKKKKNGRTITDFYVYMKKGKKTVDIPEKRIRDFNYRECM